MLNWRSRPATHQRRNRYSSQVAISQRHRIRPCPRRQWRLRQLSMRYNLYLQLWQAATTHVAAPQQAETTRLRRRLRKSAATADELLLSASLPGHNQETWPALMCLISFSSVSATGVFFRFNESLYSSRQHEREIALYYWRLKVAACSHKE
jgi:hypothetical protein